MPPVRQEYNAKARRSTAGTRKKGKLKKRTQEEQANDTDPNAEIVVPKSAQEKELDKRQRLREELRAQSDNWSSKKNKRLEKYIDKKLKKEERVLIFEKLAKSQNGVNSALLQSSSTLGTGKTLTHQERMEKDEDLQVRHAMQGRNRKRKRHSGVMDMMDAGDDLGSEGEGLSESDAESDHELMQLKMDTPDTREVEKPSITMMDAPAMVGGALRRNEDGTIAAPVLRKRSKKTGVGKWKISRLEQPSRVDDSDTSFDSSDSAYDSSSENEDKENEVEEMDEEEMEDASEDEEEGGGEDSDSNDEGQEENQRPKKLGFKEWATGQLSLAKGYVANPTNVNEEDSVSIPPVEHPAKRRKVNGSEQMRGPLGEDLALPTTAFAQHVLKQGKAGESQKSYVKNNTIHRPPDVEEARLLLPIVSEEQPIMEAIMLNPVVVICGETGSGKTTQVPQFLYEAGFGNPGSENPGMIGVTQPRRVAAISMANRVAHELSLTSSQVSYQIRYDATVSPSTSIKFMTDGVLLRELATDFLLSKYSVIIIDEAHERSINTDILIGVLSRVIRLREERWKEGEEGAKPLRLIIMSATLRVSDFAGNKSLFPVSPPIINVAARQHPVTVHFSRRTSPDYVTEAIKKTSKIHARLPPGGILIFLTGQNEIIGVCRRLEERYGRKALRQRKRKRDDRRAVLEQSHRRLEQRPSTINPSQVDVEAEDIEFEIEDQAHVDSDLDETGVGGEDDLESDVDETLNDELGIDTEESDVPMHIVPLYSLLPGEKQMEVFKPPPVDARLVVVATNVAETSLTIPGIKYVVDCGRAKERRYDVVNGIQAFQVTWVSKASAAQRAGRAGRTGPGHCYRLYSSALFEHYFQQFNPPEILRAPIEGVVLQMKNMHIDAVVNFPFPTPPDRFALQKAEKVLTHLGALKKSALITMQLGDPGSQITDLGRTMALFPLSPRYSRMLAAGQQHQCLPYVVAIVSAMSVGDPFLYEEAIEAGDDSKNDLEPEGPSHLISEAAKAKEMRRIRRKAYFQTQHKHASLGEFTSDVLKILSVVGAYEYHGGGAGFCSDHFVRFKAMEEIHKLRAQISNIMQIYFPETNAQFSPKLPPPNKIQIKVLKQLINAAFVDQVAIRKDLVDHSDSSGSQYSNSHGVPYRAIGIPEDVFLHPSSVLSDRPPPGYVVFQEIVRTTRVFAKGLTAVNPAWLSSLGKSTLCTYSKPFKRTDGVLMTVPHFGPEGWELPAVKAEGLLPS
ncbi:DHX37 protein [Macrolepiota fuliginosa MF-IS2]|uniref:RNA helicase n=1 Tax=Macrolepiota fuliginosa MF-IS2 TaxID=1400762 RepID=A0A9P6C7H5_9AGAR|nr:DHX37 protein [Macrolepiota fuliginosa MF-IS2]